VFTAGDRYHKFIVSRTPSQWRVTCLESLPNVKIPRWSNILPDFGAYECHREACQEFVAQIVAFLRRVLFDRDGDWGFAWQAVHATVWRGLEFQVIIPGISAHDVSGRGAHRVLFDFLRSLIADPELRPVFPAMWWLSMIPALDAATLQMLF